MPSKALWVKRHHMYTCGLSYVFATPWTVACQAPLSMEFSRQDCWSEIPFPSGNLSNPEVEPESLVAPALVSGFFTTCPTWEALKIHCSLFPNTEIEGYSKCGLKKKKVLTTGSLDIQEFSVLSWKYSVHLKLCQNKNK